MKAAVLYERRATPIIEDVELKPPAPDEVRIRVKAAGVSHSDYHHCGRASFPVGPTDVS
jgi:Zn-dependent alcohol dehydrogenase